MGLARRYGNDRVDAACSRALADGAASYSSVKSIPEPRPPAPSRHGRQPRCAPPDHPNLRGAGYHAGVEAVECS
jgi:hypothetical protein